MIALMINDRITATKPRNPNLRKPAICVVFVIFRRLTKYYFHYKFIIQPELQKIIHTLIQLKNLEIYQIIKCL